MSVQRAVEGLGDLVLLMAVAVSVPLAILVVGAPIVLGVRLILEIIERL